MIRTNHKPGPGKRLSRFVVALCAAALVAPTVFSAVAAGGKGGDVPWKMDPQKAMRDARKAGQGMMVYFTSEG